MGFVAGDGVGAVDHWLFPRCLIEEGVEESLVADVVGVVVHPTGHEEDVLMEVEDEHVVKGREHAEPIDA